MRSEGHRLLLFSSYERSNEVDQLRLRPTPHELYLYFDASAETRTPKARSTGESEAPFVYGALVSSNYERNLSGARRDERRAERRRRLAGFLVLLLVGGAALYANPVLLRATDGKALQRGLVAFNRGIAGDIAAFDEAETAAREALSLAAFDPFAIYVLDLTQRFRGGTVPEVDPHLVPALQALRKGDRKGARAAATEAPESAPRMYLLRLLDELDEVGNRQDG